MPRSKNINRKHKYVLLLSMMVIVGISMLAILSVYATNGESTYIVNFYRYNNSENSEGYTLNLSDESSTITVPIGTADTEDSSSAATTVTNSMTVGGSFDITVGFKDADSDAITDLAIYNFELISDGDATITKTDDTTFTVSNVTVGQNFTVIVGDVITFDVSKSAVSIGTASYASFTPTSTDAFVATGDTSTSDIGTGETLEEYKARTGWTLGETYSGKDSSSTVISGTHQVGNVYYVISSSSTSNGISISGYLDKVVYLDGVTISGGVSAISGSNQNGKCPIYVSNRGDTVIVLADDSTNTLSSTGNRAAIEKASGSTNYDATTLYADCNSNVPDSSTYMTGYNTSKGTNVTNTISDAIYDGHLTITCEEAYDYGNIELIQTTELGEPIDMVYTGLTKSSVSEYYDVVNKGDETDALEVVVNETDETVYIEATEETFSYEEVDGTKYIVYEVEKYDPDSITTCTSGNCGTLSATGSCPDSSFAYGAQGAGIGTRGTNDNTSISSYNNAGVNNRWFIPVELANLHILGGTITATGDTLGGPDGSAGIGTGASQAGGNTGSTGSNTSYAIGGGGIQNMNIYGGDITAIAMGSAPAAIGGGMSSKWVTLSIYGGTIVASDNEDKTFTGTSEFYRGAAIGGGGGGGANTPSVTGATVHIYDGTIVATSEQGAGIGAGGGGSENGYATYNGQEGHVFISGGTITATSVSGAAIGGSGVNGKGIGGDGYVYISGGTITATILDDYTGYNKTALAGTGSAIGGAAAGTAGYGGAGYVYISGGTITANNESQGSGIGGGGSTEKNGGDATVEISGGTVTATGNEGTGIGGGGSTSGDGGNATFEITGGIVEVTSVTGTGIGGGASSSGDGGDASIKITDGTLDVSSTESTGIGGGGSTNGDAGDAIVEITGGTAYVTCDTGTGIGGGASESGDGGDASIEITGGTLYAYSTDSTGIGGGVSVSGNGGNVSEFIIRDDTALVFNDKNDNNDFYDYEGKSDEVIIDDRGYNTIIYATSIGGGNVTGDESIGKGGDIVDFTIYNGFVSIGDFTLTDEEGNETTYTGSGRIGGGKVTGDYSTGDGGSIGTYDADGEVISNLEIMGGFIQAVSIGGGDVEGDYSTGDGGEIAGVRLHGGIILVEQHIGGGNVTGDYSAGDGGGITNLYVNEEGFTADASTETEENSVNTLIYTGSIGGGNVTGDYSSGDGGDITTIDIQYATFNVIGYTDDDGVEQVGHIGGGNVTGANATGNGGNVGTYDDETGLYSDGVTVHCGTVNAYSIGGGSVTDETSTGTGGFANVIIEAGFTTVEENIGGGNATVNYAGAGKVTTYGGTTVAGLIGSGFSLKYGYAKATIHFHGGSINSQVSTTVYTGGEEYSALLADLNGTEATEDENKVYDHEITLDDVTASETKYLTKETEVFLTRICYYNTDYQKYDLEILSFTASYIYNGVTYNRTYAMEDVVTESNGYIYLWLPEGAIITSTTTYDFNTGYTITYTGAIQAKSVDALKYNCSKNYYGVTFPYTTRVTFYSDAECTLEFSGKYAGIITSPYGATLEFWAQTTMTEEDFYYLLYAFRSSISDGGTSEFIELTYQSDSEPENGYYHYILTITTDTELLFETIEEDSDNRMAIDLSSVNAEVTDNSVTINGFILGGDDYDDAEETSSQGSMFLTSSGLPTSNEISFTGSDDKIFYVTLDRMVADNDDSTITINSGTVNLEFGEFDNTITANEDSAYPAINILSGATLNLTGTSTSSLSIISEADGVPAIGSSGTVNITDNGFLEISSPDGTADIISQNFTYTTSSLTGTFPIDYEPTTGSLLGYYSSADSRVYGLDYEYAIDGEETVLTATTCRVVPTSTTYDTTGFADTYTIIDDSFVLDENGDLIFNNVTYDGKSVIIEHVSVLRDGVPLTLGEDFDYTVINDDGDTNITIFSGSVYGNITVLVKFTGELLYDADDYKVQYDGTVKTFSFDLIDPVDGAEENITYIDEDGENYTVTYETSVTVYYASSDILYEVDNEGPYTINEEGNRVDADLDWRTSTDVLDMTNVGVRYIYVKVDTIITADGNEQNASTYTKYTEGFTFEITEATNRWQSALTCVSVVVNQKLTYSAAAVLGDNEDVLYTFYYYDPDKTGLFELPYTPTGETYSGYLITDDIDDISNYLTNYPGRFGITATQPAGLVYAEGITDENGNDISGEAILQAITNDEGAVTYSPYYGVYVNDDGDIYQSDGTKIENAVMNYAEITSSVTLFDVQKTKVTVYDDKDFSQLDLRSDDIEILPTTYNIGSSRDITVLVDFQYAPQEDEILYLVTSELPEGTKITLLDITDYDPETPSDDPDPSFYYYVYNYNYVSDENYSSNSSDTNTTYGTDDTSIITDGSATIYGADGEETTYEELIMIPSTIWKEMGTYDTVDFDGQYWYYDSIEDTEYATNRVRYQICIEFPEGTDAGEYYFELRQGVEEYFDSYDDEGNKIYIDAAGEAVDSTIEGATVALSNIESRIVDSGLVIVLEDEIPEPTLVVEKPVSERETITTTVTTLIDGLSGVNLSSELSDDVLAVQLYVEVKNDDGTSETIKFDFPTGTVITLDGVEATSVRGGFAVFTNLTGGEQEVVITGLEEYTYELVFYLCTDVENESYPMSNCTYTASTRVETEITSVDDPIYSIYAELDADSYGAFEQADSRVVDSATGATFTFDVTYAVENTQMEGDEITVTIQKKNEDGEYEDIDEWSTSGIKEVTLVWESKTMESQEITVYVPSGLDSGTYRINFNLDYQTYPFNIIITD